DLEMPIRLANPQVLKIGVFFPSFYRVIDGVYSCGWSSQSTKMQSLRSRKRSNSKVEYCESPLVPKNKQDRDVCARGLRSARCCTGQWDQCGFTHDTNGRGHRDGLCCPGMVSGADHLALASPPLGIWQSTNAGMQTRCPANGICTRYGAPAVDTFRHSGMA